MRLHRHRIKDVPFRKARHIGGPITPVLVVLHDTAGRLEAGNSAAYLADNTAGVSVHFVVERDGQVVQQVPTNRRASHAGRSHYHGRRGVNDFSIGIEIVNPGRLTPAGPGKAAAWFKQVFDISSEGIAAASTPEHGDGLWMDYTAEQIAAIEALLKALFAGIPSLRDIRTHWYVSPGRKIDTNPLFPLEAIRGRVLGRDDPADAAAEAQSSDRAAEALSRTVTAGSGLNLRRWPSFNPNIIAVIPARAEVPVLRSGTFHGRLWIETVWDGDQGWIVASHTKPSGPTDRG